MNYFSASLLNPQNAASTTEEVREKLHSALTMLDELAIPAAQPVHGSSSSAVTEQQVRAIIKARRGRDHFFPAGLFADPAWDMLLELFAAELGQRRMPVSRLCAGAAVPSTTALRWIASLDREGLISKSSDPLDGRRVFVRLSGRGLEAMTAYFASRPHLPI
jgi:hypothetical protein